VKKEIHTSRRDRMLPLLQEPVCHNGSI